MSEENKSIDFIRQIINKDLESGKNGNKVLTRFPPEPNGYLHIGHAKSICLNFGIAEDYKGKCNLRFDDTNPSKEEQEYVDSITEDVQWLGFDTGEKILFASDYFDQMFQFALEMIEKGLAYVDDLNAEEVREYRGTPTRVGKNSPYRERTPEENRELFLKMQEGEFEDGSKTLRAKTDMSHVNVIMRDPVMYRIQKATHHRTGDKWNIYPMYDWAHGLEDALEGITHSICTLEFENHRPLYDWFLDQLSVPCHPQQIEFARLKLSYTVMSKRKLLELVSTGSVMGWDDPRMPTVSGLRRRGFTPSSIRTFARRIGVSKVISMVDYAFLEFVLREELNKTANRVMGVLDPLKVVITNYPEDQDETFEVENNPEDPASGTRKLPFCRELFIERSDFMEEPPRKFFRLGPGREVRLKGTYFITCQEAVKNEKGEITELLCTYDPESRGGESPDGRKVKGTLHWVSARHGVKAEVRLFSHLFTREDMESLEEGEDYRDFINDESLEVRKDCILEPSLADAGPGINFQFMRQGYFCLDNKDSSRDKLVFNRSVSLKDTWSKMQKKK